MVVRVHEQLLHAALPQMRAVFLYRNAIDYVDLACMSFLQDPTLTFLRKYLLDGVYLSTPGMQKLNEYTRTAAEHEHYVMLELDQQPLFRSLGFVAAMARGWIQTMSTAQRLTSIGAVDCCLRYEDLAKQKLKICETLLSHLGLQNVNPAMNATNATNAVAVAPDEDAVVRVADPGRLHA